MPNEKGQHFAKRVGRKPSLTSRLLLRCASKNLPSCLSRSAALTNTGKSGKQMNKFNLEIIFLCTVSLLLIGYSSISPCGKSERERSLVTITSQVNFQLNRGSLAVLPPIQKLGKTSSVQLCVTSSITVTENTPPALHSVPHLLFIGTFFIFRQAGSQEQPFFFFKAIIASICKIFHWKYMKLCHYVLMLAWAKGFKGFKLKPMTFANCKTVAGLATEVIESCTLASWRRCLKQQIANYKHFLFVFLIYTVLL